MSSSSNNFSYLSSFLLGITILLCGACTMSAEVELDWEWPADRSPESYLQVSIEKIEKNKKGLFAFFKSPSVVGNIPEGMKVRGTITNESDILSGKSFEAVIPKPELGALKAGDTAVLGLVGSRTCICIATDRATLDAQNCP